MKKTYIKPSMMVVKTDIENMICESLGKAGTYSNDVTLLGKERGTRNEADDFDDLW